MSVPEAPVDEHNGLVARKDDVGTAGQIPAMKTEAESQLVKAAAEHKLRFGVLTPDTTHVEPPLRRRKDVGHRGQGAVASATIACRAAVTSGTLIPGRSVTAPKRKLRRYSEWKRRPGISVSR